ncbi:hypothetical protein LentiSH36_00814 [Lentibacter algarum]|nr:hypothetical protein LentiSH36_00814 [Lentibacter algarum]
MFRTRNALPSIARISEHCSVSTHPEAFALDAVADGLFLAGQVVLIKKRAHFFSPTLIDHALDRIISFQSFFELVGRSYLLKRRDNIVRFTRIKHRK